MLEKGADLHGHFGKAILGVGAHIALWCSSALEGKNVYLEKTLHKNVQGSSIQAAWAVIMILLFLSFLTLGNIVLSTCFLICRMVEMIVIRLPELW